MADIPAAPVYTRVPSWKKAGVAVSVIPNLLLSTLGLPALQPQPVGDQESQSVRGVQRKYQLRIDPIPNNLNKLLFNPVIAPFSPVDFGKTPWRAKTTSADMSVVAYQPAATIATEAIKPPNFTSLPTRKRQLRVDMAQNLLLVNPPPTGPGVMPVGQQIQFLLVQKKKPVYDLNSLWPNSRTFGPPILAFAPLVNQDFSALLTKYDVYDLNSLWPNSQIPGIPPPIIPPVSNSGKTRPGGRMVIDPKKVGEIIPIPFDFISRIGAGESVTAAVCTSSLFSGTDPNPSAVIVGTASIAGTVLTQVVQGGIIGNIYTLLMKATTNLGNVTEMMTFLAIEQDAS